VGTGSVATLPVSVVIPAYNRADLIARAVQSAQRQRPNPPDEVIVVDDCSSDDTGAVAERLGATVIRHEVNRGEAGARNTGMEAAAHDWVAFLDSDDEWLPDHLAQVWPRREGHVVVASSAIATGSDGISMLGHPRGTFTIRRHRDLLVPQNPVPLSGSIADRGVLMAVGGFRPWKTGADLDMWIRALDRGSIRLGPEPGYLYHVHAGQVSGDTALMRSNLLAMIDDHRGEPWWTERLRESVEVTTRWEALRSAQWAGDRAGVRRNARWLLDGPRRLVDVVSLWIWRRRVVRRISAVDPAVVEMARRAGAGTDPAAP
jgi:glycosyltransferase involved in cell wall biosynthesis